MRSSRFNSLTMALETQRVKHKLTSKNSSRFTKIMLVLKKMIDLIKMLWITMMKSQNMMICLVLIRRNPGKTMLHRMPLCAKKFKL